MEYSNFQTLLKDLETSKNNEKLTIQRKVNDRWELINLSNYRNSEDLILVETKHFAFTVTRWDNVLTIGRQITEKTN
jgi:hypothetical protein